MKETVRCLFFCYGGLLSLRGYGLYDALKWKELNRGLDKVLLELLCREAKLTKGAAGTINYK